MSRAEFYRNLIKNKNGDKLNDSIIKHIVPEILSDIQDLQHLNSKALPEMADDIYELNTNFSKEKNKITVLEKLSNSNTFKIDEMEINLLSIDKRINKLEKDAEFFKTALNVNISDINKLKNRKVVFTLENNDFQKKDELGEESQPPSNTD
jgi:hypothetical protein